MKIVHEIEWTQEKLKSFRKAYQDWTLKSLKSFRRAYRKAEEKGDESFFWKGNKYLIRYQEKQL